MKIRPASRIGWNRTVCRIPFVQWLRICTSAGNRAHELSLHYPALLLRPTGGRCCAGIGNNGRPGPHEALLPFRTSQRHTGNGRVVVQYSFRRSAPTTSTLFTRNRCGRHHRFPVLSNPVQTIRVVPHHDICSENSLHHFPV